MSGTTATSEGGEIVGIWVAYAQTKQALKNIQVALTKAGATLEHVVRTRLYVVDITRDWESVGRAHGEIYLDIRPTTAMVEVKGLINSDMLVEIEADGIIPRGGQLLRPSECTSPPRNTSRPPARPWPPRRPGCSSSTTRTGPYGVPAPPGCRRTAGVATPTCVTCGRLWTTERRSLAGHAVDALADQVGVAVVPGVLLDHVHVRPSAATSVAAPRVGTNVSSSERPASAARAGLASRRPGGEVGLRVGRRPRSNSPSGLPSG